MGLPNGAGVIMATYDSQTVQNDKKLDNDKSTAFSGLKFSNTNDQKLDNDKSTAFSSLKFSSTSEDTTPPQKFNKGLDVP